MRHCKHIRESLGAWLDGELNPADSESVRAHVESCSECGAARRQLEWLHSSLKGHLASRTSQIAFEPFWHGVRRGILEKRPWHVEFLDQLRVAVAGPRLAWAVPVVIALLLGVISYDSILSGWRTGSQRNSLVQIESIDAYGRNVALLREDETRTTIIWLYQNQEGEDESAGEAAEKSPTF